MDSEQKIRRQVEHYFGDANLRRDKWLQEEMKKDSEGYVSLEAVCNFNKMKELGADAGKVVAAVKESDVVVVSEDGTKIKRKHPLPEVDDSDDRTIYAKGFPNDTTLEALESFWAPHGQVLLITMRRIGKNFKGSVFVQLKTKEEAQAILDKKDTIKFNDQPLEITSFKAWDEEKKSVGQKRKDDTKEKKRRLEEEKQKDKETQRKEFLESLQTREIPQNLVLKVENVPEGTKRENLAEHFKQFGEVKFVEFRIGLPVAFLRFAESFADSLEKAQQAKFGENADIKLSLLTGDELKEYWIKLWTSQHDKQAAASSSRGGPPKRRRGGY